MEKPRFEDLCRRGCCPQVAFDPAPDAEWAAVLRETGGGGRAPGELRLTREELVALTRLLDREGFVSLARRSPGA